ncbi:MAG: alanine racemase [Clostridiales bacterium]|nr:alanine racemase [Clostridiales bacterium]
MSRYIIDKSKLKENIEILKETASVPIIGVVKGNGYGLGIREFTMALKENGIKSFAVTEVTDIPVLKEILNDEEVLVMRSTCLKDEAKIIASAGCTATIGSELSCRVMNEVSKSLGIKTKCHLKIDTGMGRYGFMPSEISKAIKCYDSQNLEFTGIYTHFSSAFRNEALTKAQLQLFKDCINQIEKAGIKTGTAHCANSPALLNVSGVSMDMVRLGSAFTGRVITKQKTQLNRIGLLESNVIDIKTVPTGYSVGYNGTYKTKRETRIAIVPIGHYDGFGLTKEKELYDLRYSLSVFKQFLKKKQMYVRINGRMYHVIGGIGLSHTAVDITNSDVKCGDTASVDISPLMVNPRIERIYK